ncbi:MAG TPA: hypothetical protein DCE43_11840 [Planctomycetaceae bacterium]|nr:hypothetical protein [Planctomycetaceae bacterium]
MRMEDRGTTLYPVAQVVTGYESREDDANARLIAAAPDLLAALKDVLYLSTGIPDSESSYLANAALVKVRAAIEKATQ